MLFRIKHDSPGSWRAFSSGKPAWVRPFLLIDWPLAWLAYLLSRWAFLEALEYLGSLSVLVAVIFYFRESGDRLKQKHYQAWQVVNTAQHMGGSGGRIEALSELNADGIALTGVDVSSAFLQGVQLPKARLSRANMTNADIRDSNLAGADLSFASLNGANLRQSDLSHVNFDSADLREADFCGARFVGADLSQATLDGADLGNSDLRDIRWQSVKTVQKTNLAGVRNAPDGFLAWALKRGAVEAEHNESCPAGGPVR